MNESRIASKNSKAKCVKCRTLVKNFGLKICKLVLQSQLIQMHRVQKEAPKPESDTISDESSSEGIKYEYEGDAGLIGPKPNL